MTSSPPYDVTACPHCIRHDCGERAAATADTCPLCTGLGVVSESVGKKYRRVSALNFTGVVAGPLISIAPIVAFEHTGLFAVPLGIACTVLAGLPYAKLLNLHWFR
jgi:hypothetical protein